MGFNKPITARIQHSTNKGMKVQEPLLDIGSAAKQVDTSADTSLISGAADVGAASQPVDIAKELGKGMDEAKSKAQPEKEKKAPEGPGKFNPTLQAKADKGELPAGFTAAIKADQAKKEPKATAKSLGPKGVGKNYR